MDRTKRHTTQKKRHKPNASKKNTIQPTTHVSFSDFLKTIDCDIVETMYHVYSAIKHSPDLNVDHFDVEKQLEMRRAHVMKHCDEHVKHKIFFSQMLKDAQERRRKSTLNEVKWYDREEIINFVQGFDNL